MDKKMKVIALLPFKNEEWVLPTFLQNLLPICDEIIAIDDGSTDDSVAIMEQHEKVTVYNNEDLNKDWQLGGEVNLRQTLLEFGRAADGTHFICLDADEAFSTNFLKVAHLAMSKLEPGHKLAMQWLPMWKSVTHYRDDKSIWSTIWKDFIVRDAPGLDYPFAEFGVSRTPGKNTEAEWMKLKQEHGVCMHFSFSRWGHFQYKSCEYRCAELNRNPTWAQAINNKYKITLDSESYVKKLPEGWIEGVPLPDLDDVGPSIPLQKIESYFLDYGPQKYAELDIWHMPKIRALRDKIQNL